MPDTNSKPADAEEAELIDASEAPNEQVAKLVKLLVVAQNSTEQGEVEAALGRAKALSVKYKIDLATIKPELLEQQHSKPKEPIIEKPLKVAKGDMRRPPSDKYIRWILQEHFDVSILTGANRYNGSFIYIVGRQSAVIFAEFAYKFLHRTMTRLWRKHKQQYDSPMHERNSYFFGIYRGLSTALTEATKQGTNDALREVLAKSGVVADHMDDEVAAAHSTMAMVLVGEVEERSKFIDENIKVVRTSSIGVGQVHSVAAYAAGKAAGKGIRILAPLEKHDRDKLE